MSTTPNAKSVQPSTGSTVLRTTPHVEPPTPTPATAAATAEEKLTPTAKPKVVAPGTDKYGALLNTVVLHPPADQVGPPQTLGDVLLRPPLVRQWFDNGTLYREAAPHAPARVETFFDLIFIGLINRLATAIIEEPSGDAVARFILTFYPAWAIWFEARRYGNVLGTDDLFHRTWVLAAMLGMVGYIGNASAVVLHPEDAAEYRFSFTTVRSAVGFWLVIRLVHACVLAAQAVRLPRMRLSLGMWSVRILIPMFVYLPLCWVTSRKGQIAIAAVGMALDALPLDTLLFGVVARMVMRRGAHLAVSSTETVTGSGNIVNNTADNAPDSGDWEQEKDLAPKHCKLDTPPPGMCVPAINIEHAVLRMGGFLGLIFGTTMVGLVYTATEGQVGVSDRWGKSCLGVMTAFGLNLIYGFPMERVHKFQHALRRSWWTAHLFLFLHWPLCASAIIMNAAAGRLAALDTVPSGYVWYWGCGLGFTLLFATLIAMLHKDLRSWKASRIPRSVRLAVPLACALSLILAPLAAERVSPMGWLGIGASLVWTIVMVETVGSLPTKWALKEGSC